MSNTIKTNHNYQIYVWKKYKTREKTDFISQSNSKTAFVTNYTYYYSSSFSYTKDTNTIKLINPISFTGSQVSSLVSTLRGKYILNNQNQTENSNGYCYYITTDSVLSTNPSGYPQLDTIYCTSPFIYNEEYDVSFITSENYNTYPPSTNDGYLYEYYGLVGNQGRIITGQYTGTGSYGENNPTTLLLNGTPVFIIVSWSDNNSAPLAILTQWAGWVGSPRFNYSSTSAPYGIKVKTFKGGAIWFNTQGAYQQLNALDQVYDYVAFCV